jgi:hypothetical protein
VHLTLNRLNGKTYVNLINVSGEHTNQSAIGYDQVPALENLEVRIRTGSKPADILLQPEGKKLKFSYSDGVATVRVSRLELHSILEISFRI